MRIIGLDLGNASCGVAMSDISEYLASGVETVKFKDKNFNIPLDYIVNIVDNNKVGEIVLGLPRNMDGSIGEQGKICLKFKEMLEKRVNIPIIMLDERLTTRQALNTMNMANMSRKTKKVSIDTMAAVLILQDYLDKKRKKD